MHFLCNTVKYDSDLFYRSFFFFQQPELNIIKVTLQQSLDISQSEQLSG